MPTIVYEIKGTQVTAGYRDLKLGILDLGRVAIVGWGSSYTSMMAALHTSPAEQLTLAKHL